MGNLQAAKSFSANSFFCAFQRLTYPTLVDKFTPLKIYSMITWIQIVLQKHHKPVFMVLLVAIVIAFVFTIGSVPFLGDRLALFRSSAIETALGIIRKNFTATICPTKM